MTDTWAQRSAEDFAQAIEGELPQGAAWPRDPDGDLMRWVDGCAQIWGDVSGAAALLLLQESDPSRAVALLPDWERAWGLPDLCNDEVQTIETRRNALISRMTSIGGQSRAYFTSIAASIGYTIKIYEYQPYQCGLGTCGETRPEGELTLIPAECGVAQCSVDFLCNIVLLGGDDWIWRLGAPTLRFYWRVSIANTRLSWLRASTGEVGVDHMCEFGLATDLECLIRRLKPAHTYVIFDYSQVTIDG